MRYTHNYAFQAIRTLYWECDWISCFKKIVSFCTFRSIVTLKRQKQQQQQQPNEKWNNSLVHESVWFGCRLRRKRCTSAAPHSWDSKVNATKQTPSCKHTLTHKINGIYFGFVRGKTNFRWTWNEFRRLAWHVCSSRSVCFVIPIQFSYSIYTRHSKLIS